MPDLRQSFMSTGFNSVLSRWLVAFSAVSYATFGVLGQGLHSVLPGGDACCETPTHDCCDCGHVHPHSASHRPVESCTEWRAARPRHDAANCSICALLAKINVGYATADSTEIFLESIRVPSAEVALRLPSDLVLHASARGPPVA